MSGPRRPVYRTKGSDASAAGEGRGPGLTLLGRRPSSVRRSTSGSRQRSRASGQPSRPARPSKCLTEEGCQRVPPRGVRSRMASSWAAICCSVRSGAAALMPATNRTSRSSLGCVRARSSKLTSRMPSPTSRRTVRRSRSAVHWTACPRFSIRTTSPQGWSGRIRRTPISIPLRAHTRACARAYCAPGRDELPLI